MNRDLAVFGANVRRMRNDRGWTQKQLADLCDVNIATIGAVEKGVNSVGLHTAIQLARIFGVGLDTLTSGAAFSTERQQVA